MPLYHYKLGIPRNLVTKFGLINLNYGLHALERAYEKAGKNFPVPKKLNTDTASVIEVETNPNGELIKVLYRIRYNAREDLCIVIIPWTWKVKTVWLNDVDDKHYTLNERPYTKV